MSVFSKMFLTPKTAGGLKCPLCSSFEIRKDYEMRPLVTMYRCKKCGSKFIYDQTPMPGTIDMRHDPKARQYANPYNPKNGIFKRGLNKIYSKLGGF